MERAAVEGAKWSVSDFVEVGGAFKRAVELANPPECWSYRVHRSKPLTRRRPRKANRPVQFEEQNYSIGLGPECWEYRGHPGKPTPWATQGISWIAGLRPAFPVGHSFPTTAGSRPTAAHSSELGSTLLASCPAQTDRYSASVRKREPWPLRVTGRCADQKIGEIQSGFTIGAIVEIENRRSIRRCIRSVGYSGIDHRRSAYGFGSLGVKLSIDLIRGFSNSERRRQKRRMKSH